MTDVDFSKALHIAGDHAGGQCLKVAWRLRPDRLLINADSLSVGPALATTDPDVWYATRNDVLREIWLLPDFSFRSFGENDVFVKREAFRSENLIIFWAGIGLSDQVTLAWIRFLFDQMNLDSSRLMLVQLSVAPENYGVQSVAAFPPDVLVRHYPPARRLKPLEQDELRRAWQSYTHPEPSGVLNYLAEPGPLPLLRNAMETLIHRYPDHRTGLGVQDEALLRNLRSKGRRAAKAVAFTMGRNQTADDMGPFELFWRLRRMADGRLREPLVTLTDAEELHSCNAELTPFGQAVLEGKANAVEVNGIDDWIGGVHLTNDKPVTFRDGDTLLLS